MILAKITRDRRQNFATEPINAGRIQGERHGQAFSDRHLGCHIFVLNGVCVAQPVSAPSVKIGVLTDMGSVFSDFGGPGSIIAAKMAVQDSSMADKVQLVSADHQNKLDVGACLARAWFEQQGVDAIFDVPTFSVVLAVNTVARQDKKLVFFSTAIIDRITEEDCNGYGLAWTWNIWSVARSAAVLQMQRGYKNWYNIGQDYAAGHAFEQTARQIVAASGGTVLGSTFHPLGETEYSAYGFFYSMVRKATLAAAGMP